MIVRYPLSCSNCGTKTVLRIGVGYVAAEPFRFSCEECGHEISGVFNTDQLEARVLGLSDLQGCELSDSYDDTSFYHTYHPDFPFDTNTPVLKDGVTLTPFIQTMMRQGKRSFRWMGVVLKFLETARTLKPDVVRASQNFRRQQWKHFDRDVTRFRIVDAGRDSRTWRARSIYLVQDQVFKPIIASATHTDRLEAVAELVDLASKPDRGRFDGWLKRLDDSGLLLSVQREQVAIAERFVREVEEFRGVLPEWNPDVPPIDIPPELQTVSSGRFHEIKGMHVDAFETISRSLTLALGLRNLEVRGDVDRFPPHAALGRRYSPRSIDEFHSMSNAPKIEYFRGDPLFGPWIEEVFDPKLRNAIGHNSADYNPVRGVITYQLGKRVSTREISYSQFLFRTLRMVLAVHDLHFLVRILAVVAAYPARDLGELTAIALAGIE